MSCKTSLGGVRYYTYTGKEKVYFTNTLQSITYFKGQHGITIPRFSLWLWVTCLATEFCRIFKENNEIDQPGSYMPYFMELKLSTKSLYSTTMNPNIHYFIHWVGSASGQTRSKNARYLSTVQVESVTQNSIMFAYAFKNQKPRQAKIGYATCKAFVDHFQDTVLDVYI